MPKSTTKSSKPSAKQFAAIENLSIGAITERMGPVALHVYADAFLSAARKLPPSPFPFEPVRPYLVCHAIELSLKAFLSLQGTAMLELAESKYGHDLQSLLHHATKAGITNLVKLSEVQRTTVLAASHYYVGKVFEYPAVGEALKGYPRLPTLDLLFGVANTLVDSLRQSCHEAK